MTRKDMFEEPMYDTEMLELIEEQQTAELISAVLRYTKDLEKMVIDLRSQVNNLTAAGQPKPYFDLHSDIYEVFYDYPAYQQYQKLFNLFEIE